MTSMRQNAPISLTELPLAPLFALNNAHARELSELTAAEFQRFAAIALFAKGFADPPGFLMAFDQDAAITGPNFLWFKARMPRFIYVDRVVIDPKGRGQGLARKLYETLIAEARRARHALITCEINSDPPNPASDAFHTSLGFKPVGSAHLADRGKTVRYMQLEIGPVEDA